MCNSRLIARTLTLSALLLLCACSKTPTAANDGSIHGVVADRGDSSQFNYAWLTVKTSSADPCGVIWRIFPYTKLRKRTSSGASVAATFDQFKIGSTVHVFPTGVTTDTCPGQGSPTEIQLQ